MCEFLIARGCSLQFWCNCWSFLPIVLLHLFSLWDLALGLSFQSFLSTTLDSKVIASLRQGCVFSFWKLEAEFASPGEGGEKLAYANPL